MSPNACEDKEEKKGGISLVGSAVTADLALVAVFRTSMTLRGTTRLRGEKSLSLSVLRLGAEVSRWRIGLFRRLVRPLKQNNKPI